MSKQGVRDWGLGIRECERTPALGRAFDHPQPSPRRTRRGISLMEVLISMFILAVGLLGVAALIPAGRHEIVEATKLDNAAMVGRSAFRDMQVRGFLNPAGWMDNSTGGWDNSYQTTPATIIPFTAYDPATGSPDLQKGRYAAYVIDPLGMTAPAGSYTAKFPFTAPTTLPLRVPPLIRILPFNTGTLTTAQQYSLFDSIMRSSFDQILEPNATNTDFPPSPKWFEAGGAFSRRMSDGNYSWMATVVSDPTRLATTGDVTVSVAVFYKRDLSQPGAGEADSPVSFPVWDDPDSISAWLQINNVPTDASGKLKPLKPGQWIMLGGSKVARVDPVGVYNYYRWYKVISAAPIPPGATTQRINIAGSDWVCTDRNTRAWIFDNIVNVYEKQMPLEIQ